MYRSLEVRNFRGLKSLSLDDLGTVNLITGLNDAGKTSLLEAIFLHASGPLAGLFTVQTLRPSRRQEDIAVGPDSENPWNSLFHGFNTSEPIEIEAKTSVGPRRLRIAEDNIVGSVGGAGGAPSSGNQVPQTSVLVLTKSGNSAEQRFRQSMIVRSGSNAAGPTMSIEFRLDPQEAEPFFRAAFVKNVTLGSDLAAGFSGLRKAAGGVDLLKALQEIDERIEHLEVLVENGRPQLHAEIAGVLVPFQLLGDGPNAVAQYLVSMVNAKGGVLLIDEIGSGVHHTLLPAMWRSLYRAAKRLKVQVFATTHSQEAVIAAQEMIHDSADALVVHRLRRRAGDEKTHVGSFSGSKLKTAVDANADLR